MLKSIHSSFSYHIQETFKYMISLRDDLIHKNFAATCIIFTILKDSFSVNIPCMSDKCNFGKDFSSDIYFIPSCGNL